MENGSVCDGNVTIRYREFHSQADMVIGNIPMDFLQGKQEHQLESGGMFEIYADCGGTPLKLAPGKKIQVRFASKQDIDGLSAFYFDNSAGWQLLPTPVIDMSYSPEDRFNYNLWGDGPPQVTIGNPELQDIIVIDGWEGEFYDMVGTSGIYDNVKPKPSARFMGMDIARMGLFNYDRILNEEGSIPFAADFKIKGEKTSIASRVYITYSGLNTVVYYTPEEWAEKFSLLPRKDVKIFSMLQDGRVAVMLPGDLEKLNLETLRGGKHTFELVIGDIKPETKEQLASIAGIQP